MVVSGSQKTLMGPPGLAITIQPEPAHAGLIKAICVAGGRRVPVGEAEVLVWMGEDAAELSSLLSGLPAVRWVQLPSAGVDTYLPCMCDRQTWTRAQGVYGVPVAEHALMLALACLRGVAVSVRSRQWSPQPSVALTGEDVLIVGGGSIATALLDLLNPFDVRATVLRCHPRSMAGAASVLPMPMLDEVLPCARVVFLCAPLTPQTDGLIDAQRMRLMRSDACLVNVARGRLVVTDDLVGCLSTGQITAAGLDVTDPEPLPSDHPLWRLPNCIITAHSAGELGRCMPAFVQLVENNIRRWRNGEQLIGQVDITLGY